MNIALFIKQVPHTEKIKIDASTGMLIRKGVEAILNPYCESALNLAVSIKKSVKNTKITVFTMGPQGAELALRRALALGADEAVLISGKAFAGSDCFATAHILSKALSCHLRKADLVICGKQAIDGETAQVPGEMSEILKIPLLPNVTEIVEVGKGVRVKSEMGDVFCELLSPLPALITVQNSLKAKRFPTVKESLNAYSSKIIFLNNEILNCKEKDVGLSGSLTKVVKVETVANKGICQFYNEENLDKGLDKVLSFISSVKGGKDEKD
ncbi:MAG: electron transfer flavoprotein subunit beta/FixA family protein [bacterium]